MRDPEWSYRPHMPINNVLLDGIQIKKFSCIFQRHFRMRQPMEMVSCLLRMCMPIIEKKIMEHSSSGSRFCIQMQETAPLIIIICYVNAMIITTAVSMVRIQLHAQNDRMCCHITNTIPKIFFPIFTNPKQLSDCFLFGDRLFDHLTS